MVKIKKIAAALLVMTVMVGALSVNAFASHGYRYTATTYAVCPVEDCSQAGTHNHDGTTYAVCPVEDCSQTGAHNHDGTTYCGHYNADGHTYHPQEHANGRGHNSAYGRH